MTNYLNLHNRLYYINTDPVEPLTLGNLIPEFIKDLRGITLPVFEVGMIGINKRLPSGRPFTNDIYNNIMEVEGGCNAQFCTNIQNIQSKERLQR